MIRHPRILNFLIAFDLFMSAAAFRVDWPDFHVTPWYLWIFVPICPLYPLLLAVNFIFYKLKGYFVQPLIHFTAVGIIGYGLMAYLFYPSYMAINGKFMWYEFGNVLWVTLYAAQILFFYPVLKKIHWRWYLLFAAYYFSKDFLDRFSVTFSYQRAGEFTNGQADFFLAAVLIFHVIGIALVFKRSFFYNR